jgi:Glutamine amidotransferase domain
MGVFTDLLFLDTIRGFDSTGVFGVDNNSNVVVHKDAVHGVDFLITKEYREFKAEMIMKGKFVVGHNRAATRGTINDVNAHPFVVDDKIVLVQNGTYKGDHKHLKNTDVDTEAVAHVISENDNVTEALQKINAAYALVWYNAEKKELNLIRNSERPLYLVEFYNTGFAFASEAIMLEYAFTRADMKIKKPPEMLPEHTLVTLTMDGKGGYTRKDEKIDAAYKYPKSSYQSDEAEWWEGHFQPKNNHHYANAYQHQQTQSYRPGGADDVRHIFADAILKSHTKYLFPSREEATKHVDFLHTAAVSGKHYIEMIDYLPCNDNKHCTAWHVFGTLVHQDEQDGPTTLIHWIEYGKTEEEILNATLNTFYKCTISAPILRSVNYHSKNMWLSSVYCSEKVLLKNEVVQ